MYSIRLPCNKTRNQQQKKLQKIFKQVVMKKYTVEQQVDHWTNKGQCKSKDSQNQMKMKTHQNLWNITRAILRKVYSYECLHQKKTETLQINNLIVYLKLLEKQEKAKPPNCR
jgi:hypothetical protein